MFDATETSRERERGREGEKGTATADKIYGWKIILRQKI